LSKNETQFARYREGYEDGYEGRTCRTDLLQDSNYIRGYAEGTEDDRLGVPCRFTSVDPVPVPVPPSVISLETTDIAAEFRVTGAIEDGDGGWILFTETGDCEKEETGERTPRSRT
jgi:hypothetical protein